MNLKKALTNKYVVAGAVSIFALGGLLYYEYKRLLNYSLSYNRIKVNSVDASKLDIDLFTNFKNKSAFKIEIISTDANVFLNNSFVTNIKNTLPQVIQPEGVSELGFNVVLSPEKLLKILNVNISDLLLHRENIILKVDLKIKVKLYFFTINIPYTYENNLKSIIEKSKQIKK